VKAAEIGLAYESGGGKRRSPRLPSSIHTLIAGAVRQLPLENRRRRRILAAFLRPYLDGGRAWKSALPYYWNKSRPESDPRSRPVTMAEARLPAEDQFRYLRAQLMSPAS